MEFCRSEGGTATTSNFDLKTAQRSIKTITTASLDSKTRKTQADKLFWRITVDKSLPEIFLATG
ncbi:hypothetical protein LY78DRAFT_656699 [Colletotrichum sublineola]|nr:hypothetical protein LY78DRAFT_656699 [Colletotrichum sublineola]